MLYRPVLVERCHCLFICLCQEIPFEEFTNQKQIQKMSDDLLIPDQLCTVLGWVSIILFLTENLAESLVDLLKTVKYVKYSVCIKKNQCTSICHFCASKWLNDCSPQSILYVHVPIVPYETDLSYFVILGFLSQRHS